MDAIGKSFRLLLEQRKLQEGNGLSGGKPRAKWESQQDGI